MEKKVIILFVCGLVLISGLLIFIPNNYIPQTKPIVHDSIFRYNGNTILSVNHNNITTYYYDNNLTEIKMTSAINSINTFSTFNDSGNLFFEFSMTANIPYTQIVSLYGNNPSIPVLLQPKVSNTFLLNNSLILPVCISGTTTLGIQNNGYYNNYFYGISELFQPNTILNITGHYSNAQSSGDYYRSIIANGIYENPQAIYSVLNNSVSHTEIIFGNQAGFYKTTFNNYIKSGNLTLTNNSGYKYTAILTLHNLTLPLQNGSYNYTFSYISNNQTYYINGSFNISGLPININLGSSISTILGYFDIIFIVVNIATILLVYYASKNYLLIIPIQALFLISGYILHIQNYSLMLIVILILFLSLYIATKIMGKIGD